jgi:hypothetical protein
LTKAHHGRKARLVMTQAGEVHVSRVYRRCVKCQVGGYALDERLGLDGRYSPQARRLISLAAASWSYDLSSTRLQELCGLSVSDTTIREIAQETGAKMLEWQRTEPDAVTDFRQATGDVEFTTDGTSVNTTDGWREVKVGLYSKRDRGESATPDQWGGRQLPRPKTSVAFAAIEASDQFGARWKAWAKRLSLSETSSITVLADGAKWIWEEARRNLPGSLGVLDIYHALEHVSATSKALFGDGTPAATAWTDQLRTTILERGWDGFEERWQETRDRFPADSPQVAALNELRNYLGNHVSHMNYAERLRDGRSIGSGQIEGACKNLIGRRLKQTAARWRTRRLNRMAGLCSVMYSQQWAAYWNHHAP